MKYIRAAWNSLRAVVAGGALALIPIQGFGGEQSDLGPAPLPPALRCLCSAENDAWHCQVNDAEGFCEQKPVAEAEPVAAETQVADEEQSVAAGEQMADDQQVSEESADQSSGIANLAERDAVEQESTAEQEAAVEQSPGQQLQQEMAPGDTQESVADDRTEAERDGYNGKFEYVRPEDAYGDQCDMTSNAQGGAQLAGAAQKLNGGEHWPVDVARWVAEVKKSLAPVPAGTKQKLIGGEHWPVDVARWVAEVKKSLAPVHALAAQKLNGGEHWPLDVARWVADVKKSLAPVHALATQKLNGGEHWPLDVARWVADVKKSLASVPVEDLGVRPAPLEGRSAAYDEANDDEVVYGDRDEKQASVAAQGLLNSQTRTADDMANDDEENDAGQQPSDRVQTADSQREHGYGYGYEYARPQEVYGHGYSEDRDEQSIVDESGKREPGKLVETAKPSGNPTDSDAEGYEHSWTHEKYGNSVDASGQATEQASEESGDESPEHRAERFGNAADRSAAGHGMDRPDATPDESGNDQGESQLQSGAAGSVMPDGASLEEDRNGETGLDEAVPAHAEAGPVQSSGNASLAGLPGNHRTEVNGQDGDEMVSEPGDVGRHGSDLTGVQHTISSGMVSATALLDRCKAAVRPLRSLPAGLDWRALLLYGEKAVTAMGDRPADASLER
jgi:hypothetical protein